MQKEFYARVEIVGAPRTGIKNDSGEKLRFYIADNKFVSHKK